MKKLLLGTTALAGALVLANAASAQMVASSQPFTVTIGGYANFWAGLISGEQFKTAGTGSATAPNGGSGKMGRNYDFFTDSELWVTVQAKADNGLVYGMRMEIELDTPTTNQTDEMNLFVQGGFGRIELGDEDSFSDRWISMIPFGFTPPSGFGLGTDGGIHQVLATRSIPYLESLGKPTDSSDATKISYATPVFGGFQAAVSFSPDGRDNGGLNGRDRLDVIATGDVGSANNGEANMLTRSGYENFLETGVQWSGTFGGFGVRLAGTYHRASAKDALAGVQFEDISAFGLGAGVTFAGFTVGGNFIYDGKSRYRETGSIDEDKARAWLIGAQYAIGPWTVGGNYQNARSEGDTTLRGNDKMELWEAGVSYLLAPGLSVYLNWVNFEMDNEGTRFNDGDVFLLATRVSF